MANRDILVLNTTQSRAETQQGTDAVTLRADSSVALSIENSSDQSIVSVNTSGSAVGTTITGNITASGHITSSLGTTTASFGRLEGTTLIGSAFNLSNTDLDNTLSSSAQIANEISGSFRQGFEFTGLISGSRASTGSFGRIELAGRFFGDANNLTNSQKDNTISSSAQLATSISGSFNKGFEFVGSLKASGGTWSATNTINYARTVTTGFGSVNAAVLAGGNSSPVSPGAIACSETWNGTNWSEGNDLIQKRSNAGSAGTATAGLVFGGSASPANNQDNTETYNGTNYSEVNNLNTGRYALAGFGTQNSAIAAAGAVPNYNSLKDLTEEWNGTNWTEVNDLPYTSWYAGTAGDSSESGILFGGSADAYGTATAKTSLWNGTNWSEVGDMNTARIYMRGQGSTNNAIGVGGLPGGVSGDFSTCTETWDGSSWSTAGSMIVANRYAGVGGNGSGAIAAGLSQPGSPYVNNNSELFELAIATGSFTEVISDTFIEGDVTNLTVPLKTSGTVSSSAQLATAISGSFNKGFAVSGNISGSRTSTGSFAHIKVDGAIAGDISALTNTDKDNTISSSAQLATAISGSFNKGFAFSGTVSGSADSTGSFLTLSASKLSGDGHKLTNTLKSNVVSSSAQLATSISGSFNKGFEFTGKISGSVTSTGSFNLLKANEFVGTGTSITNIDTAPAFSGSAQLATSISGSFNKGFVTSGDISGSADSTASIMLIKADLFVGDGSGLTQTHGDNTLSGSSGIATFISGAFNRGFIFNGDISGSADSTGSFSKVVAETLVADGSLLGISPPTGAVSSSAQLAKSISGSFTNGFEYTGDIRTAKGVWSTGGNLIAGRNSVFSAGTADAALAAGGSPGIANSEEYNGSAWTEGNNMITARSGGGAGGSQNAAVMFGGSPNCTCTEEYNGTSYGTGGAMNLGRFSIADGNGTQNAALAISGYTPGYATGKTETELYDGAAWSEVADVNLQRGNLASAGTANATVAWDGYGSETGGHRRTTEIWDGSSWSIGNPTVGTLVYNHAGSGTVNAAFHVAGIAAPNATPAETEHFDGNVWSIDGNLNIGRHRLRAGSSTQANGLVYGGSVSPAQQTEEYNAYFTTGSFGRIETPEVSITGKSQLIVEKSLQIPVYATSTGIVSSSAGQVWFTTDDNKLNFTYNYNAWTETAALPTAIGFGARGGAGSTMNDALHFQGTTSQPSFTTPGATQRWNGTAWSEVNATNTGRAFTAGVGLTADSALNFGGCQECNHTEEWNGTNWSEVNNLNNGRQHLGGAGSANAAWATQGVAHGDGAVDKAEAWDGTSWSTILSSGTPAYNNGAGVAGTQQAHMFVTVAPAKTNAIWDGTSYSYANNLGVFGSETGEGGALFGTVNSSVYAGGQAGTNTKNTTYEWNGTSWNKSSATLAQAREETGTAGNSSAGMIFAGSTGGGSPYSPKANSEQYITVNIKTQKVDGV